MTFQNKHRFKDFYNKIRNIPVEYNLNRYLPNLDRINEYELADQTDHQLKQRFDRIRPILTAEKGNHDLLMEFFAIIREVSDRQLGLRHYDVQMVAALALSRKRLIQMNTGEGKTLVALMPAILEAIQGKGCHIFTANDYLAKRDALWMTPVYKFFDLTVGYVKEGMDPVKRKQAYDADITYLTAKEAGFDFLRDQMVVDKTKLVQRPFHHCIVDEADFILIDEARVPLVIAGSQDDDDVDFNGVKCLLEKMIENEDFKIDEQGANIEFTDRGIQKIEAHFYLDNIFSPGNQRLFTMVYLALHAQFLLQRDRDYIVKDDTVSIVDSFTGRIADRRRWPHGIHCAVEAKEDIPIRQEGVIYNLITIQHFIGQYPGISGMTATAVPAAEEFFRFYSLPITVIPPNQKNRRIDHPDRIFKSTREKNEAILEKVSTRYRIGQPVLIGTGSVSESEQLSRLMKDRRIPHTVLNAKNNEAEADIIAEAGKPFQVTISTNMAGRGVDIKLGRREQGESDDASVRGGLYVIGTNRHESRRIDNQLRGRAGRQGDPGESEFFISMEDDLMVRYQIDNLMPSKFWPDKSGSIGNTLVLGREIRRAQRIIEGENFDIRKTLWEYSTITELQSSQVEQLRRRILNNQEHRF